MELTTLKDLLFFVKDKVPQCVETKFSLRYLDLNRFNYAAGIITHSPVVHPGNCVLSLYAVEGHPKYVGLLLKTNITYEIK